MKMYLISDNIDTYTGMRLAGSSGAGFPTTVSRNAGEEVS